MIASTKCEAPGELEESYKELLDQNSNEQTYQKFIEHNTYLIPREFIQNHGLHFSLVLRKLAFGSDFISDFAYLSKSTVSWNCVLIEIEKPSSKFFKNASNGFHRDFTDALQQISDWRAWFDEPSNKESFVRNTLGFIRTPLSHSPVSIKYVLVLGRRSEIESNPKRLAKVRAQERGDFRVMTFDSLASDLRNKNGLYIAAKHNTYIDILNEHLMDDAMFGWMEPETIKVPPALRAKLEVIRGSSSYRFVDGKRVHAIDHYLDSTKPSPDRRGGKQQISN